MKVIFLDIDGVLNSYDNMHALHKLDPRNSGDSFGAYFDERCVRWLSYIINETDCKIVISSTWRCKGIKRIKELWETRNLPGEIIGVTPHEASEETINLYAATNNVADRGYEIQEWIDENKPDRYCIIDDDDDMLPIQKNNFVKTSNKIGLDLPTSESVIVILNSI